MVRTPPVDLCTASDGPDELFLDSGRPVRSQLRLGTEQPHLPARIQRRGALPRQRLDARPRRRAARRCDLVGHRDHVAFTEAAAPTMSASRSVSESTGSAARTAHGGASLVVAVLCTVRIFSLAHSSSCSSQRRAAPEGFFRRLLRFGLSADVGRVGCVTCDALHRPLRLSMRAPGLVQLVRAALLFLPHGCQTYVARLGWTGTSQWS